MEERHTIEDRYVVFEYNKKASPAYIGCRFMTAWTGPVDHDPEGMTDIIAENISLENAQFLIRMASKDSLTSFYESLPGELKTPDFLRFLQDI